jgi:hypothetical protein
MQLVDMFCLCHGKVITNTPWHITIAIDLLALQAFRVRQNHDSVSG